MTFPGETHATGGLFALRSPLGKMLTAVTATGLRVTALRNSGWYHAQFQSEEPLAERDEADGGGYRYPFLIREVERRFLVVAPQKDWVDRLLVRIGQRSYLRSPSVKVHAIAGGLLEGTQKYALSGLWAKVNGFGRALRSATFYGDDMRQAPVIQDMFRLLVTTRVQLRDLTSRQDIMAISASGDVDFFYRNEATLLEIDACLRFLRVQQYLTWPTPANDDE